jgi:ATP-dependent Clp protease ATP-binding subunit ClpA
LTQKPDTIWTASRFTGEVFRSLTQIGIEATKDGQDYQSSEHLLLAVVAIASWWNRLLYYQSDPSAARILKSKGINYKNIRSVIKNSRFKTEARIDDGDYSIPLNRIFARMDAVDLELGSTLVDTKHMLIALIDDALVDPGSRSAQVLKRLNVDLAELRQTVITDTQWEPAYQGSLMYRIRD